MRLFEIVA